MSKLEVDGKDEKKIIRHVYKNLPDLTQFVLIPRMQERNEQTQKWY